MTLGRGLESLIPQNSQNVSQEVGAVLEPTVIPVSNSAPITAEPVSVLAPVAAPVSTPIDEDVKKLPPVEAVSPRERDLVSSVVSNKAEDEPRKSAAPPSHKATEGAAVFQIEVDKIGPNPFQPRREFNEEGLRELAQSVREYGVIQPLIVTKIESEREYGTEVRYQLIAGERRLRAAKMVGLERVPVIIKHVDTKKLNLELAIVENVQRADLSPLDEAKAYARLQDDFNLTQREIAARVAKSRESVANTLRLLSLPSFMQDALRDRKINESQARVLLSVADLTEQQSLFHKILDEKISVRQLKRQAAPGPDPEKNYLERQLEEKLGAPVEIKKRGGKGKLVIKFFSDEEMRGVLERLLGQEGL